MESDVRFYRRRASEELAAAGRAVTQEARERRLMMADIFLERLRTLEAAELELVGVPQFAWQEGRAAPA